MEGEAAKGSSIEALVDKELLELVFLSPACLNDSHLRILPLVCRYPPPTLSSHSKPQL